jgi:hypothetical protein
MKQIDNEEWILLEGAFAVEQKASAGLDKMDSYPKLVYALWVADYGMRNAGDLETSLDIFSGLLELGKSAAISLGLPKAKSLFALSQQRFEQEYFEYFEQVCDELRNSAPDRY